jgi:hypothetical protein
MAKEPPTKGGPTGRPVNPAHPVKRTSIPSDSRSATGRQSMGGTLNVRSRELNLGTGRYGSKTAGSKSDCYDFDWKKS